MSERVIVASNNPVKLEACKLGFEAVFPGQSFALKGVSVDSGVRDQPMSDEETFKGASQRVQNAREQFPEADYWVGLEGGLETNGNEMEAFAWIVIESANQKGKSRTATFSLPTKVVNLIRQGMELGEADDVVFGKSNSKQKNGAVGLLTGNVLTRATYYREAVILSLIPFKNRDLYSGKEKNKALE